MKRTFHLSCLVAGVLGAASPSGWAGDKGLYRFMAGDGIRISVPSHTGYDQMLTVQPDGRIYVPMAGEIMAVGMTVPELQERVRLALETQLEKPQVTVSLVSTREGSGWVTILGAVNSAGRLEPRADWTLTEALAAAGLQPNADLTRVELVREGQTLRRVDLSQFRSTGKIDEVIPVQAGDIIIVPEAPRAPVSVLGEVMKPGVLEWTKGMTVLDALNAAGGATPKADLPGAELTRDGKPRPLDLEKLLKGDHALNEELKPGDTVVVPESKAQVFVLGRVGQPNAYPLKKQQRVLDLLMTAGGPLQDASLERARLLRVGPDGKAKVIDLNLERMMARGDLRGNHVIQPNDILVVPQKGKSKSVRDYLDWVWPVNSLYSLLRIFQ